MRRRKFSLLAAFLGVVLLLTAGGVGAAAPGATGGEVGSYIVVFRADVADPPGLAQQLAAAHRGQAFAVYQHALKGFAFRGTAEAARALARNPNVAYVEPDGVLHALAQTVPTGILRMGVPAAYHDGSADFVDVDVAVLDTGVDYDHPDLNVVKRIDCTNESGGPPWSRTVSCVQDSGDDGNGHGTHVAGTIGALDNSDGVVGVAPGARIWAIKVLTDSGSGSFAMIVAGVDQVAANAGSIEVANMSLGGQGESQALQDAIANAVGLGVVFVVAAGNSDADIYGDGDYSTKGDNYIPASYPEVMTVSALADSNGSAGGDGPDTSYGPDDTLATFSNFSTSVAGGNPVTSPGAGIDVAAPGVDIRSTYKDGGYATASGTSMASPHVAGWAALYIASNGLNPGSATDVYNIRQAIIDGAQPQSEWRSSGSTNDPDSNHEGMAYAGGGSGGTDPAPGNTAPTAGDGSASTQEDQSVAITLSGSDAEDCELSFSIVSGPSHGSVSTPSGTTCTAGTPNADAATVTYTPDGNYNGSDAFTFRVTDSAGAYDDATVSLTVSPVNDAPAAADDSASTTTDTAVTIAVLANDSDPDGDGLSVTNLTQPANGAASLNADGTVTYTPNPGFTGSDSFTYQASDGTTTSSTATVSITVQEPSTGWSSGDLEGSVWSDSGNPNGKYSTKDYSFTPALGSQPTQISVKVNISAVQGGSAKVITAYIRMKGSNHLICQQAISGAGEYTLSSADCSSTAASLVTDGASNTVRLEVGPLYKNQSDSFSIDFVQVDLQ
ncbi:MAG: S8 family serine peptidase [Bacillota bacterium]